MKKSDMFKRINFPAQSLGNGKNIVRLPSLLLALIALTVGIILLPGAIAKVGAASITQKEGRTGEQRITSEPGIVTSAGTVNLSELAAKEALRPVLPGKPVDVPYLPIPSNLPVPSDVAIPKAPQAAPAAAGIAPNIPSPTPLTSFQALNDNNATIPPDTNGAVGSNHLMTTLNTQIRIQNRAGGIISTVSLLSFWTGLGHSDVFDPKVLYDPFAGRWMFTTVASRNSATSAVLIAVSQTDDPTGVWNRFSIDADPMNTKWADFPSIGFNKDWIVINVNMFNNIGNAFAQTNNLVCVKANIYANVTPAGTFKFFNFIGFGGTQGPAITHDNTLATLYFLQDWNGNSGGNGFLRIYTLTGAVGSETMTPGGFPTATGAPWDFVPPGGADFAPQMGSAVKIQSNDSRMRNVVYRNGSLWTTHTVFLPAGGAATRSAVQWWQIDPGTLAIQQRARIDDATGTNFFAFPSIAVNSAADVFIGYSRFSAGQFASANYSGRRSSDPLNTLRDDAVLKAGEDCYFKTFAGAQNRWGDYSNTVVDPSNDFDIWTIQEYAAASSPPGTCTANTGRWGTWWGRLSFVPTDAEFASFTVKGYDGGQYLRWQTAREVDNLGFNVYRDESGKRVRLNSELLAGSALAAGPGTTMAAGMSYGWWDSSAAGRQMMYWVEQIDLKAESKWHGPVAVERVAGAPPERSQAALLNKMGNPDLRAAATYAVEKRALSPALARQVGNDADLASQRAAKLLVKHEGFYRVTPSELAAAGVPFEADPRLLQLYVDGEEQAFNVITDNAGKLSAVEFYGIGADSPFTLGRVYWLVAGTRPGLRIQQVPAAGTARVNGSFPYTVERKDRLVYFTALRNGEKENFFGAVVGTNPVSQILTLPNLNASWAGEATLKVALQGVTHLPHRVKVQLNSVDVGEVSFKGQLEETASFAVPHSILLEGANTVKLAAQSGESDISLVSNISISYQHTFVADNDALKFIATAGRAVSVDGFINPLVRVFDVTSPGNVQELIGSISPGKAGHVVTVMARGTGQRTLLAVSGSQVRPAANVARNQPSTWRQPDRGADLVVVSHSDFASRIAPLVALRQGQGLSVSVVDIEDLYDEFRHGQRTPHALRDFLIYAGTSWKKAPRFALLVGDASIDPKDYLGVGDFDFVPTRLIDTSLMETACDDCLADFDSDGLAELAMGRLPARSAQEATAMIAKIFDYEDATPANGVLLVSDAGDTYNFESVSAQLRSLIPRDMRVEEIDRARLGDATARALLMDAIGRRQKIINYNGHGNLEQWRGDILTSADATAFTNDRNRSFFVMMTCLNGYFQDATTESLAEALIKTEGGGAVAVWASSGMCEPGGQALLNQNLYRLLFNADANGFGPLTLGEAVRKAKASVGDGDIRRTWVLLADPSMRLR
ncbi:MAG TPA: C25 family cysteine peptidase [Blastocatellia bacterium]|nr:C25 family cysteine peptidase [Blastocatellia bacterium]